MVGLVRKIRALVADIASELGADLTDSADSLRNGYGAVLSWKADRFYDVSDLILTTLRQLPGGLTLALGQPLVAVCTLTPRSEGNGGALAGPSWETLAMQPT